MIIIVIMTLLSQDVWRLFLQHDDAEESGWSAARQQAS